MDEKIRFRVLGITYNQIQSGAYALILAEDGGRRRPGDSDDSHGFHDGR